MLHWNELLSGQQFKDLLNDEPLFAVFKHSTRCSISDMAKNRLEREWKLDLPIYYLDLLEHRDVSNLIAELSGIEHQSPQLLVFRFGKVIYHASHNSIDVNEVREIIDALPGN